MNKKLAQDVREFLIKDFSPSFGDLSYRFSDNPLWEKLRELGTELWLDTGNIRNIRELWTKDFTALTTNNTLLNHEVQQGTFDTIIQDAHRLLAPYNLSPAEETLEIAFILNAWHALRLVERFDAFVSVEEHTDLAHDQDRAVEYGVRYYEICPERFIVKIPFTPAGLIAARRLSIREIPVNLTLGFSARQNYVATRLARPRFVNVFLGRLGSFTADNGLGSGEHVGEAATLASQRAVRKLREMGPVTTRQIGASFRNPKQVVELAGIDVMTMPPAVADAYRKLAPDRGIIRDRTGERYEPGVDDKALRELRFETFWEIPDGVVKAVDELEAHHEIGGVSPEALVGAFAGHGVPDLFPAWSEEQRRTSTEEGKIPGIENWKPALEDGTVGLDALMTFAGLNSFTTDQNAMDSRVNGVLNDIRTMR